MIDNMDISGKITANKNNSIWVISDGKRINLDPSSICEEPISGPVTEYRISELAGYLLDPNPITLEEKVVGCKAHHQEPAVSGIKRLINKFRSKKENRNEESRPDIEEIISASRISNPAFEDETLNAHFLKISDLLRPYDPVQKRLSALDKEKISDITAICEEIGGNRYPLNLQGSIEEKINFVSKSISKKAKVVFNKAYLLNGLFELRGFKFDSFKTHNYYRLIKFTQKDSPRYYVVDANFKFKYWVSDNSLVSYIHIFEHSIRTDPKLREALQLCINGSAKPLKLFFSKKLEQKYSDIYLPTTYREVLSRLDIDPSDKETIATALNDYQNIVFLNYVPGTADGNRKLFTHISVLHDFKALEAIRNQLPEVYSEINKKTSVSDAGRLYLLDSMRESKNV